MCDRSKSGTSVSLYLPFLYIQRLCCGSIVPAVSIPFTVSNAQPGSPGLLALECLLGSEPSGLSRCFVFNACISCPMCASAIVRQVSVCRVSSQSRRGVESCAVKLRHVLSGYHALTAPLHVTVPLATSPYTLDFLAMDLFHFAWWCLPFISFVSLDITK